MEDLIQWLLNISEIQKKSPSTYQILTFASPLISSWPVKTLHKKYTLTFKNLSFIIFQTLTFSHMEVSKILLQISVELSPLPMICA